METICVLPSLTGVYIHTHIQTGVCAHVCVCVYMREREREGGREKERERNIHTYAHIHTHILEYYSATKNEILPFMITCMILKE